MIMFNAIVVPNAHQELLFTLLLICSIISLYNLRISLLPLIILFNSFFVTILYIFIGLTRGASSESAFQTLFIYILSPILWLIIIKFFWDKYGLDFIIKSLAVFAILACASIPIYIYLFLNHGPNAVSFFGGIPNVDITKNYSGVSMHVSGSLIFLGAAFTSGFGVLKSRILSYFVIIVLVIAIISVGRTMAIVSMLLGFSFYFMNYLNKLKKIFIIFNLTFLLFCFVNIVFLKFNINIIELLGFHFQKVMGGDKARPEQVLSLIDGAESIYFLGAGHGLGVDYLRSEIFPWRYEAVYFALLYKIGLVGLLIVTFPLISCIIYYLILKIAQKANKYDDFFGVTILVIFLAGFTNPYPEAFSFQWMYVMPIYYFYRTYLFKKNENNQ